MSFRELSRRREDEGMEWCVSEAFGVNGGAGKDLCLSFRVQKTWAKRGGLYVSGAMLSIVLCDDKSRRKDSCVPVGPNEGFFRDFVTGKCQPKA